jgi:transposase InsO family protein
MSKARLVITAVMVEKRPVSEVARSYGVARSWIYALLARYREEGEAAFEPRSRRPKTCPRAIPDATASLITEIRKDLAGQGLDAGPQTIAWHLAHHHRIGVSAATVSRYLARAGLVTPDPRKRPRSSYLRFAAELPNECWQSDFTHYPLAGGTGTEILAWLDDHSRYLLRITAHRRVAGPTVVTEFGAAVAEHGIPASTLTGNGLVFTTRFAGGRGGRNGFEAELRRLGVKQKNGKPSHPQTQGKIERFWQTLKTWLAAQPPSLPPSPSSRPSWTPSPPSATSSGRTAPSRTEPPPPPPTPPGQKPHLATGLPTATTASAPTASMPTASSPCGSTADCTTSASGGPMPGPRPDARPGPAHPGDQRRHRGTPARADPRPHQGLPAHRPATQPTTPNTPAQMRVRGVLDLLKGL